VLPNPAPCHLRQGVERGLRAVGHTDRDDEYVARSTQGEGEERTALAFASEEIADRRFGIFPNGEGEPQFERFALLGYERRGKEAVEFRASIGQPGGIERTDDRHRI